MRILVTGADGFIGSYLMEYFAFSGAEVWGTSYRATIDMSELGKLKPRLLRCDIRDFERMTGVIRETRPDVIFHMAAQSFPAVSWKIPIETLHTNVIGTANLFEAIRLLKLKPIVIVACSSAEYGVVDQAAIPVKEEHPLLPLHPYGVSKVATDLLSYQYWVNDKIHAVRARIFNTTGPRKTGDVCADLTHRAVAIEHGESEPVLRVGNLDASRAILDVRDTVDALILLADKARPGEAYNICGGRLHRIREIVEMILKKCRREVIVRQDPSLLRPNDERVIYGDSSRLTRLGWTQKYRLEDTVQGMLDFWRQNGTVMKESAFTGEHPHAAGKTILGA